MKSNIIPFMLPDITDNEINEVIDTLKSNWITTGIKTKQFENNISVYCNTEKTVCLNSATACLFLILKMFDIGEGDEVITTPYTFASTANVILHAGAKPVFVDIKDDFNMDPEKLNKAITNKTKAVIPIDIGGFPCDYDEIKEVLNNNKRLFNPKKDSLQKSLDKPLLVSDSAHSLGAIYKNNKIGGIADFTVFSFHATKNMTTAEGGAVTFNTVNDIKTDDIYNKLMLLSLHGQSKDAFSKMKGGNWRYTIDLAGYKFNMPDISASIGLSQLKRYDDILGKRKKLFKSYIDILKKNNRFILPQYQSEIKESSYHLFLLRIKGINEKRRDDIINEMAEKGISCNVHFIPLAMHPFYKSIGYNIKDYPYTYSMYENEISLPLYSTMEQDKIGYICEKLVEFI